MSTVNIKFEASVTMVQRIIILNNDTQEEFIQRLRSGRYLTTLSFDYTSSGRSLVTDMETMEDAGLILRGDNVDEHTPYSDFEIV